MDTFLNCDVFLPLVVILIDANSAEPDKMQHYASFHLDKVHVYEFSV